MRRVRVERLGQRRRPAGGAGVEPVQDPVPNQRGRSQRPVGDRRADFDSGSDRAAHGARQLVLEPGAVERGRDPRRAHLGLERGHREVPRQVHAGPWCPLLLKRVAVHVDEAGHAQQPAPVEVGGRAGGHRPDFGDKPVPDHHACVIDDRRRQDGAHAAEHPDPAEYADGAEPFRLPTMGPE